MMTPQPELLHIAEAIMRRVDDFKTVAVNGYDDPRLRDLLIEATNEVIAAWNRRSVPPAGRGLESGWLIEHGTSPAYAPRYWCGAHGWTTDNLKAVRFAREIDARLQAEAMDDGVPDNYRIAEHGWG